MRVLITGFGPFPGAPFNPSAALAKALARRRRPALADIERIVHVFATAYGAVDADLPGLLANAPDVVLMFGVAGRRRALCIETRARNATATLFPDARGQRPKRAVIAAGALPALPGRAPFMQLRCAARTASPTAQLSCDAGRYLCNYAYWRALEAAGTAGPLVQFVHIPPLGPTTRRRRAKSRTPALAELVAAAEALLIALVAAASRR